MEFVLSVSRGFILGALVLAVLLYLEHWWKKQEVEKLLMRKKRILAALEEREKSKLQDQKRAQA